MIERAPRARDGSATALVARLEGSIVSAAIRRAARHPTRRLLWTAAVSVALVAAAVEIATSGSASRDLGSWAPSPAAIVAVAGGILAIAALFGRRTALTYGTRAADPTWWRYAGIDTGAGRRATTAILAMRTTALVAALAVPLGGLFAVADPARASAIVMMAVAAIVLAPLVVLASSATASRTGEARPPDVVEIIQAAAVAPNRVPRGLLAARWLVARRRREPLVPFVSFAGGLVVGVALPSVAARAGGQATALAVVIGGFALLVDGALRRTTAPATLLVPWWRTALGTSVRAIVAWAVADAFVVAAFGAGVSLALGAALRAPLLGIVAVPLVVSTPVALRMTALAVDSVFPGDRRGPAAFVRVLAVGALTVIVAVAGLGAGARGGVLASLLVTTAALVAVLLATAAFSARRLAASP
jgi:hypothetical protein